ncbi:MAG TPA: hypothetical protein V6D19_02210 [Stenomitos sp.]
MKKQQHQRKRSRRLTIVALAASVILGGSLSFQHHAKAFSLGDLGGIISGILEGYGLGGGEADKWVTDINKYLEEIYAAYGHISSGNWQGLLDVLKDALGEAGIIDPLAASQEVSEATFDLSDGKEGFIKNADFPEAIFDAQRSTDAITPMIAQKLSSLVLSEDGQSMLKAQGEQGAKAGSLAISGQEGVINAAKSAQDSAKESLNAAISVARKAKEAQSRQASQDILKDLAAQNGDIGEVLLHQSNQQVAEVAALANQAAQLTAIQAQSRIQSDQLQMIQMLAASQNQMLTEVDSTNDQHLQYDLEQDRRTMLGAYESSSIVYLPGFMKP